MVLVAILTLFASCTDDEPAMEESPRFDISSYNIQGGLVFDYGAVNYVDFGTPTHYNYDFTVFDGTYDTSGDSFRGSLLLIAELLSPGTSTFEEGIFSFILPDEVSEVAEAFYFNSVAIFVDGNGNNALFETDADENEDLLYFATSGTITVVATGDHTYTLNYDLTLSEVDFMTGDLVEGSEIDVELTISSEFEIIEVVNSGRKEGMKIVSKK